MDRKVKDLAYEYFIENFANKDKNHIGVEVEMAIVNLDKKPVEEKFIKAIFNILLEEHEFVVNKTTIDFFPIEARNGEGDVFSLETSFNTIEFSMAKRQGIDKIAESFYKYLKTLKKLEKQYNYLICGMGINPYPQYADSRPLRTPSMLAKHDFLKDLTSHKNGQIFPAFSASVHIHFDADPEIMIERLNLLRKLSFVSGILFSNSLPFNVSQDEEGYKWKSQLPKNILDQMDNNVLCFRDLLWKYCESPNVEDFYRDYKSIDDLLDHLIETKLFVIGDGDGNFRPIEPISFREYFAHEKADKSHLAYFRSMEPVAISKYGTFEIRSVCTQALTDIFEPVAFYAGILENQKTAKRLVDSFFAQNNIQMTNKVLREKAIFQEEIVEKEKLDSFIRDILSVAYDGLKKRNRGETIYLEKYMDPDHPIECPAKRQIRLLEEGHSWDKIVLSYSSLEEAKIENRKMALMV